MPRRVQLTTELRRKRPSLPVFLVVPAETVRAWGLAGTAVIEGTANGVSFGRRSIKAWGRGADCWFIEFTQRFCDQAQLRVGETVVIEFSLADTSPPPELAAHFSMECGLEAAWERWSERDRREAGEHIRAAKQPATCNQQPAT
ncbi:MAG: hypothetical protein AAGJ52_03515, partial [Pseudomonadota bacterium]